MSGDDQDDVAAGYGKIIAKAWRDPAFKAQLIANPVAALKAEGFETPEGMTVSVVEDTDKHVHLVLPPTPTDELSDQELDSVAGGLSWFFLARMVGGAAMRNGGSGGGGGGSKLTEEQRQAALRQLAGRRF